MVTVEYWSREGHADDLFVALEEARFSRRRTGASGWRIWQDAGDPLRIVEQFVVASWSEHLRQHERVTVRDQRRLDAIRALTDPAPRRSPTGSPLGLARSRLRHQQIPEGSRATQEDAWISLHLEAAGGVTWRQLRMRRTDQLSYTKNRSAAA